ncbi:hypothetical protein Dsin_003168 [Dipteronia sinensis]|uniref:Uncharacterized protein n=1 Tax=Dipteronia sinensis TaxID=43782 RepID=A0AAE0B7H7_9ROSI|nr:hypothetical protein Dsin_003168 [Dipteronia sinensis]
MALSLGTLIQCFHWEEATEDSQATTSPVQQTRRHVPTKGKALIPIDFSITIRVGSYARVAGASGCDSVQPFS